VTADDTAVHGSAAAGLIRVAAAYAVALLVAAIWLIWGPTTNTLWLDTLIADVLATLVVFAFSRRYRNSSFYDAYWSVIPPLMLLYWWWQGDLGIGDVRCWLLAVVVGVWASRLTWNWASTFPGLHHEDWRYDMIRSDAGRWEWPADLFAIHLIPTMQVFLAMLPVYVTVTRPADGPLWLAIVAFVVGLGAIGLESVADAQLRAFTRTRRPGDAMDRGLWAWSRHPNYFGEWMFWVALALFGIATSPGDAWWLVAGAIVMLAMFEGASIPMMERRSLARRPEYQQVIDSTPRFLPRPPRIGAHG
jgi:steroid 5-alpha reductase family enzyme